MTKDAEGNDAEASDAGGAAAIQLPVSCQLREAEEFIDQVSEMDDDDPLVLDASDVEQMSAPYALAIISAIRHRSEHKPPAAVVKPAPVFIDAFSDLGLFQDMMKMEFR